MIYQRHTPLDAAVAHLTKAARSEGRENMVMTADQWKKLILSGGRGGAREFGLELVNRVNNGESVDVVNRFLTLAMDIWNAMPETIRRLNLRRMEHNRLNDNSFVDGVGENEMVDLSETVNEKHSVLGFG
jgi:hypothetical protein